LNLLTGFALITWCDY